jgi:hypothetical protein
MSGKYRNDVNQTQVDLCYVWKPTWTSWVIVDPQVVRDSWTPRFFWEMCSPPYC